MYIQSFRATIKNVSNTDIFNLGRSSVVIIDENFIRTIRTIRGTSK